MGLDGKKKKIGIIAIFSIFLVAAVGGVTYGVIHCKNRKSGADQNSGAGEVKTTTKAIKAVCQPTDYKETCETSLASANTSNPKELIKIAFQATMANIRDSIKDSSLDKEEAYKDTMNSQALEICKEVLSTSIEDIQSSIDRVDALDLNKLDYDIGDLKTWIGGAVTFHETCLDAFENTTGDAGEKMKKRLKTAGELTSNGLAMVSSLTKILGQLQAPGIVRRLLDLQHGIDGFPSFVDAANRKLLSDRGNADLKPNVVVAQDGSGQFKTINEALKTVPLKNKEPFIIFVKAGVYEEYVSISKDMKKVVFIGEGPTKTKITGNKNFADGTKTYHSATVAVDGNGFIAKDIGFENSAGPTKHQAVALRVTGDDAVIFNCQMDGYQDTLYAHNKRQFYRDCTISGTIDFVFGDAQAIFQNCKFIVRKPMANQGCMVTAQGRKDRNGPGAFIFQNSQILAAPELHNAKPAVKAYLGRPWKMYSRAIIMNSFIDGFIAPEGWSPWMGDFALDTLYYGEYENKGPGADTARRVTWKGIQKITLEIAESFTPKKYYQAGDAWILAGSIPYDSGIKSA